MALHKKYSPERTDKPFFISLCHRLWKKGRGSPFFLSLFLHLGIFLLLWLGVPSLPRPPVEVPVVFVEFAPVGAVTQTPSQRRRAPAKKKSPVKKNKPAPEEDLASLPEKMASQEEHRSQEAKKAESLPVSKPEETKKEEIKKEETPPKKESLSEKEEKSPEKKEEVRETKAAVIDKSKRKSVKSEDPSKKKKKKMDFAKMMDAISQLEGDDDSLEDHKEIHGEKSAPAERLGDKLSISEEDAVRRQIESCWNVPTGAKDAHVIVVELRITTLPDGTVQEARIVDQGRLSDPFFRAMAESAQRAVFTASPLKLPPHKYAQWKQFTMNFNPRDMY